MSLKALGRLCLVRVKVERAKHLSDLELELVEHRNETYTVIRTDLDPDSIVVKPPSLQVQIPKVTMSMVPGQV